jgi:hypothetical protein
MAEGLRGRFFWKLAGILKQSGLGIRSQGLRVDRPRGDCRRSGSLVGRLRLFVRFPPDRTVTRARTFRSVIARQLRALGGLRQF